MPMTGNIDRVEVITSVQRRRRWSAEEKARIVQETYAPGMSVSLVARKHGIAPNQVLTWRQLYAEGAEAGSQPLGDFEPLLDGRQQQDAGVRGEPSAVEPDVNRLARDGWQPRQNPRTFLHGGCELRCLRMIRLQRPDHTRIQWFMPLPPPSLCDAANFPGSPLSSERASDGTGIKPESRVPLPLQPAVRIGHRSLLVCAFTPPSRP